MKNKLLLLLVILSVSGCALEEMRHEVRSDAGRAFSVEQAKEFFETDYADMLTRSQGDDTRAGRFRGRMYPGDFTPLWDKAEYSESDGVAAYDVDILADRKVIAIRSKFGAGGAKAERLNVYQKLVVRRDVESGKMAAYVMSLIPDIGGDDRRIPERFRSRGKDKGGFCGIVVYATTDRGALVRVQEYKDGVLKRGVYIPSGKGSYIDRCVKAREILSGIALISKQCIRTKAGEDNWGDDYEDWYHPIEEDEWWVGNFMEIGYGVYTDGNGHYYIDNDGDGLIDEETIAPGYIEDEEPEEPWTEENGNGNENGGDDGDNENEGNNEGGETDGDDNIYRDDHNDDSIIFPSPLTEFIGRPEFYDERHNDFLSRFPNKNAPEYYKKYGYKYCKKFQDETRHKLSEAGKEWVDKTLVALQLKLNAIIMKDPLLELNETQLKTAAFDSHVEAYIESGVLELPLSDKIDILLTVDWVDLSSSEGFKQVLNIIGAQLIHYVTYPDDMLADASYLKNNYSDILSKIRIYYDNARLSQPTTKSATPELSEEYIYELILGPLIEYYEEHIPEFSLPAN